MTIDIDGDYTVGRSQTVFVHDEDLFHLIGDAASVDVRGTAEVFTEASGSLVYASSTTSAAVFNERSGGMRLSMTGDTGAALGLDMAAGSNLVTNDGYITIEADHVQATGVSGADLTYNGSGVLSVTAGLNAYGVGFTGGGSFDNDGQLRITGEASETVGVTLSGDANSFVNRGSIHVFGHSVSAAGVVWSGGATTEFRNEGSIYLDHKHSGGADAIRLDDPSNPSDVLTIINDGVLQADSSLRDASATGSIDHVFNTRTMTGTVDLGLQDDQFFNSGKLLRAVELGGGADSFDGTGGTQKGLVDGGLGDDSLLGGAKADKLSGGDGLDRLTGAGGADQLTGGAGADIFAFTATADSAAKNPDLILDLAAEDRISLHAIDADTTRSGNQDFTLVAALDGHAGEAAMSYDAETGRTTLVLDVDGDGQADAAILMAGDQTGFTNFVL